MVQLFRVVSLAAIGDGWAYMRKCEHGRGEWGHATLKEIFFFQLATLIHEIASKAMFGAKCY